MPNVEKTPRRTVRVEEALWAAAQDAAEAEGRTVSDVIRDALTRYVKRAGK
jgi:predicted transcriptional regulator